MTKATTKKQSSIDHRTLARWANLAQTWLNRQDDSTGKPDPDHDPSGAAAHDLAYDICRTLGLRARP